jgi:hypothetical protein
MATDNNSNKSGQGEQKPVKLPADKPVFTTTSQIEIKGLKKVSEKPTQKPTGKGRTK